MSTSKANTPNTRDSIYSTWMNLKNLSKGREIKGTIYNIGVVFGIAALVAFIFVLLPFLKPLLWALLIGAVVYPLKRKMSSVMRDWFDEIEAEDGNLFLNIAIIPVRTMDSFGEGFITFLQEHKKILLIGVSGLTVTKFIYEYAPKRLFCYCWRAFMFIHLNITNLLSQLSATIVIGFLIGYLTMVFLFWKSTNHSKFMIAGQSLWLLLLAYVCSFLGPLQVPAFIVLLGYGFAGLVFSYKSTLNSDSSSNQGIVERIKEFIKEQNITTMSKPVTKESLNTDEPSTAKSKNELDLPLNKNDEEESSFSSDMFFKVLFYSCAVTIIFKNLWLLIFSVIPIILHFIKQLLKSMGVFQMVKNEFMETKMAVEKWISERYSAIFPICLPGVILLNYKIHNLLRDNVKSSIDLISSIVVIVLMILIVISTGMFFAVQIYSEGFQVAQLTHDVIQKAFIHRPELKNILPENTFDNLVDNAHQYGRNTIDTYIEDMLKDTDKQQAQKLKEQILTTWDRIVQNMLERGSEDVIGPKMGFDLKDSLEEIVDNPVAKEGIIAWAKSNVGMLKEVMDSVLIILKNNIYLIGSILGSIFSVLLGGGYAVITFIVDTIIFFTALFYLLSSSQERYTPLVCVTTIGFSSGPRIAEAIEGSIAGVITATAKIALFHGMFTWLTHTVFMANVVYLPAVLAATLAAAPFLGTYWCAVPAFFDLWLAQDRFWTAVVLLILHVFIPSSVDAAVYAEIKSAGHPYLTGLSIAGGLYWLGLQGAILGPLLLCFLVIIVELTLAEIKESPPSGIK